MKMYIEKSQFLEKLSFLLNLRRKIYYLRVSSSFIQFNFDWKPLLDLGIVQ